MKKYEKEVLQASLEDEAQEIKHLKAIYNKAAEDIAKNISITDGKIEVMLQNWDNLSDDDKSVYQSKIYQKNFQKQLQQQINDVLQELNSGQYKSIDAYLKKCYESGYIGTMYSISKQGIPIIAPIDQKKVIRAMKTNSKISNGLYAKLGEDVDHLKKRIANNISRGIATADSYENIARNITRDSNVGFNKALRISRTEGHRIHSNSSYDAMVAAKESGAEIVKMWESTMDGKTRSTHRLLDGQIREVEEPFEMGGKKAMYPSDFGRPEEDINCRCALLQRATWALDEDELETLKKRAEYFGLDKTDSINAFQKKYLKASGKMLQAPVIENASMAKTVGNFVQTLETSNGVNSHVKKMRMHAEYVDYAENKSLSVPFSYNIAEDVIEYNPTAPNFDLYDLNFVQVHELTHRMDVLEYNSIGNSVFIAAVESSGQKVLENAEEIADWFVDGGKYANNAALSDIISALSKNRIDVPIGHSNEYWEEKENVIREVFANISALDVLDNEMEEDIKSLLKELFESYEEMVK